MCSSALTKKANNLDSIITDLVELNKKAGKSSEYISVLISRISSSLDVVASREQKFFNLVRENCKGGKLILREYIRKLKADMLEMTVDINKTKENAAEAEKSKGRLRDEATSLKINLKGLTKKIDAEWEKYRQFGIETEQKFVTIKHVRDILTDELLSKGKSFIQMNSEAFAQKVDDLKTMLHGLTAKESMYSSMAYTLLQVAENRRFSDGKLLNKLLDIFVKIEKNLLDFKKYFERTQKKIINDIKIQAKAVRSQVGLTMRMLKEATITVEASKVYVVSAQNNLKFIQRSIERKMIQVRHWAKICKYESKLRTESFKWRTQTSHRINQLAGKLG